MTTSDHRRVLYAEDNEDSHQMIRLMCKFVDIEVIAVKTVAEAWQLAQSQHFDLYLLDLRFSDGDGLELCRRLREYAPRTPILIYSGYAFIEDKKKRIGGGRKRLSGQTLSGKHCPNYSTPYRTNKKNDAGK